MERKTISYLPACSFLTLYHSPPTKQAGRLIMGSDCNGRLPFAPIEAAKIAAMLETTPLLAEHASVAAFKKKSLDSQLIHVASHAFYRSDNPLFSAISLRNERESLTVLDIFELEMEASLVTLSACQTGLRDISGGDEIVGMMRAFLCAGAQSLILTLWSVNDHSTALLMERFYQLLVTEKIRKDSALQLAQRYMLSVENRRYQHPLFWAPFFLVGASGTL